MYEWYNDVIHRLSAVDASLPIYLSDGWDLGRALRFTRAYNNPSTFNAPVVVDVHKYWTFDEKDTSRLPYEIIDQAKTELAELDGSLVGNIFHHQAAVAAYVEEYSLALAPQTWSKAPADQKRPADEAVWPGTESNMANESFRICILDLQDEMDAGI